MPFTFRGKREIMNIQLLSTDELINELISRFDSCAFYGLRKDYKGSNDAYYKRYRGKSDLDRIIIALGDI